MHSPWFRFKRAEDIKSWVEALRWDRAPQSCVLTWPICLFGNAPNDSVFQPLSSGQTLLLRGWRPGCQHFEDWELSAGGWGCGVRRHLLLACLPGGQVRPQRAVAPAGCVPLRKGLCLGMPGARPSSLASAASLLPSPFLASSSLGICVLLKPLFCSLGIRVLLKPFFCCFSGVLAEIGRRCSCSNCLYSEVSITLIS